MGKFRKFIKSSSSILLAAFMVLWQAAVPVAFILETSQTAHAANEITVATHEGQLAPSGNWSSGNITTYAEGEEIDFRFVVDSSTNAEGKMQVEFSERDNDCLFFTNNFQLGTIEQLSGATPTVSLDGGVIQPTGNLSSGRDWIQKLNFEFSAQGSVRVNYTLTLSNEAGNCGGSSQHSRLGNVSGQEGGAFANIGNRNVPIPAKDILILPSITITKSIASGTALAEDFSFNISPAINNQSVFTIPAGQSSVFIDNVDPSFTYTITESGPADYAFSGGSGVNCSIVEATIGLQAGQMIVSGLAAGRPDPTSATCNFINDEQVGSITIVKDAQGSQTQDFEFTAQGQDVNGFTLTGSDSQVFSELSSGTYSFAENPVSGWDLTDISCTDQTNGNLQTRGVSVELGPGQNITCTFTNVQRGKLIVTKKTLPANDPTVFQITASGSGTVFGDATRNIQDNDQAVEYDVTPGTYNVDETLPTGWRVESNACQNVVVAAGQTVECEIVNLKLAKLTVIKDVISINSGPFPFSFLADGPSLSDETFALIFDTDTSKTYENLEPGTYTVTEDEQTGWKLTDLSCGNHEFNNVESNAANLIGFNTILAAGADVSCTFTNTQLGSILGTKYEANSDSSTGSALPGWFIQLFLGDELIAQTETDADGNYAFNNLLPGEYIIMEILQDGWTQIFAPVNVNLQAGEESTDNDFGNFRNGRINGFKYEDSNANGSFDSGSENKLSDWEFTLRRDSNNDGTYDQLIEVQDTDIDGNFSFTNLAPGSYQVCETPQTGWIRTEPVTSDCRTTTFTISNTTRNMRFGNRPVADITVVKNVDTNGDGQADQLDVNDWQWQIDDGDLLATGSTNTVQVTANNTYTISEIQQDGYTVTGLECGGQAYDPAEQVDITFNPGDSITCVFTNTRDTGTITIVKQIEAADDVDDSFDFTSPNDGVAGTINVENGAVVNQLSETLPTGTYTTSEVVPTGWDLNSISCRGGENSNISIDLPSVTIELGQDNITCTFTNTQRATIIAQKITDPANDPTEFDVSASTEEGEIFNATTQAMSHEDKTAEFDVSPGHYSLAEDVPDGWFFNGAECDEAYQSETFGVNLNVQPGQVVTCTFTNTKHSSLSVVKQTDPAQSTQVFDFAASGPNDFDDQFDLDTNPDSDNSNQKQFSGIRPGNYNVSEGLLSNWTLSSRNCVSDIRGAIDTTNDDSAERLGINFELLAGENVTCTFLNTQQTTIEIVKVVVPAESDRSYGFTSQSDNWEIDESIKNGEKIIRENLAAGTYVVSEDDPIDNAVLSTIVCTADGDVSFGSEDYTVDGLSVSIDAVAGHGTITCLFTNIEHGRIVVTKVTDPADATANFPVEATTPDGQVFGSSTDTLNGDGDTVEFVVRADGDYTYNVDETSLPDGWDQASNTCLELSVEPGQTVRCVITNVQRGTIVIEKEIITTNEDVDQNFAFTSDTAELNGVINNNGSFNSGDNTLVAGEYTMNETPVDGWILTGISCSDETTGNIETGSVTVDLSPGQEITCTFTNTQLSEVIVTKYNDINRNETLDDDDDLLENWTMLLCSANNFIDVQPTELTEEEIQELCDSEITNSDGDATFANVLPNQTYLVDEILQEDWEQSAISCSNTIDENGQIRFDALQTTTGLLIAPEPGETVNCQIGNFQGGVLEITKTNNRPDPTVTGDTVTYSLIVSVPEDSGAVFNTSVQDLPPANFTYVPGSWTAFSSERGNLKAIAVTPEPAYASPGQWTLGTMLPGEVVTLTYQTVIGSNVITGAYPDLAFSFGCSDPSGGCTTSDSNVVFANVSTGSTTPFVGTEVSVVMPAVLGASTTRLVETGTADIWRAIAIGSLIILVTITMFIASRPQKKAGRI